MFNQSMVHALESWGYRSNTRIFICILGLINGIHWSVFLKVKYQHGPTNLSYFFFIQSKPFIIGYKWFKPLILMLLHHHRKKYQLFFNFFDKENRSNFNNTTHILINIHINYRPFGKIQNWLLQCLTRKM